MPPRKTPHKRPSRVGITIPSQRQQLMQIMRNTMEDKQDNVDAENETLSDVGPYVCTGDFEKDFTHLCQMSGMGVVPPVVPRLRSAAEAAKAVAAAEKKLMEWRKPSMKKGLIGAKLQQQRGYLPIRQNSVVLDSSPKVSLKQMSSLQSDDSSGLCLNNGANGLLTSGFSPRPYVVCVQVEYSVSEDTKLVTEVFIRNWKVDVTVMEILQQCCPLAQQLRTIFLWNVGLTPRTLDILLSFLPRCERLTSLTLDSNSLADACLSDLLQDDMHLENLSLRFCQVNDTHIHAMGKMLGTTFDWNRKLLFLNLANNKITDVGARSLAGGLMTNRTLLTLNLAGNQIGDDGATALSEALSSFPLDMEQMKERRQKMTEWDRMLALVSECNDGPSICLLDQGIFEMKAKRRNSHMIGPEKKKKGKDKDLDKAVTLKVKRASHSRTHEQKGSTPERTKGRDSSSSSSSDIKKPRKSVKLAQSRKIMSAESVDHFSSHPLLDTGSLGKDGQFWLQGNRTLTSLNLARNRIGDRGIRKLWKMVQTQSVLTHRQVQTGMMGLKRMEVHRNAVPADHPILLCIQHRMLVKDPLYKMPQLFLFRDNVTPCAIPTITI